MTGHLLLFGDLCQALERLPELRASMYSYPIPCRGS